MFDCIPIPLIWRDAPFVSPRCSCPEAPCAELLPFRRQSLRHQFEARIELERLLQVAGALVLRTGAAQRESERRSRIALEVRETNLPAQLFFRTAGFRATSVLKDFYQDTTEDAYLMEFSLEAGAAMPVPRRLAG